MLTPPSPSSKVGRPDAHARSAPPQQCVPQKLHSVLVARFAGLEIDNLDTVPRELNAIQDAQEGLSARMAISTRA